MLIPQELGLALGMGFVLGVQHATDADHVVAVSTLAARRTGAAWLVGAAWGLGHTATLFALGGLIVALKASVPESLALSFEFCVGVMLVVLGALNIAGRSPAPGIEDHAHPHGHDDRPGHGTHVHHLEGRSAHSHRHVHLPAFERLVRRAGEASLLRSFGVGMVHGLAGSSAVALTVLAAIPGPVLGAAYLLLFGFGTLAGMSLLTAGFAWAAGRLPLNPRWASSGAGAVSVVLGLYIMYRIGFVEGLFSSPPLG